MPRYILRTYNHVVIVPVKKNLEVAENGYKELNGKITKEEYFRRSNIMTPLKSEIIIERKHSLLENKIIISRKDNKKISKYLSGSFFYGSWAEIPDSSKTDEFSQITLKITDIGKFEGFNISYFLKQNVEQYYSGSRRIYKYKGIKLMVSDKEARLIYPNGMARIYLNL